MKWLISALLFCSSPAWAGQSFSKTQNPCVDPNATIQSIALNASTTSAVQIIALSGTTKIYVCSITVQGGGTTPTLSLVQGTGTNCATGQTTLITAVSLPTTQTVNFVTPVGVTPAGNAICTLLGGTAPTAKGVLSFIQQ